MRVRLLLLAAALAAFGGSLLAGFHLDDYAIFSDPLLRSVSGPHPLTALTFWVNYQVGGQEPLGYHAFNLLLHLGAVLLAYQCLLRLLPPTAATVAAAIFAVHPLQAEAVNYVAGRGAMLAALICFAALLALQLWRLMQRWQTKAPALVFTLAALIGMALVTRPHGGNYAYVLVTLRFLRLLLFPWGFTIDPDVHEPLWLAIAAAVAVAAVAAWMWRKKLGEYSSVAWFLAGLVLLIPNSFANPATDARMYLPLFAFAASAGLLLERIPARQFAIGLVAVLTLVSVSRTYVWISEERIWREAVNRAPDKAEPKIQLAKQLKAADALELLGRARQQAPYNSEIPAEIGKVLLDERQYEGALDELSRAVALNPRNALAFNNRGVVLAALGQMPAASTDFQHALALDPSLAEAQENLKRLGAR